MKFPIRIFSVNVIKFAANCGLVTFMGEIFDEEQFLSSVTDTKVTTSHW